MTPVIRRGYVQVGRTQIHYRRAGEKGAPPLVLLHQTPSHSAMFEPLMRSLAPAFELFAPDTPGFGQSDAVGETFSVAGAASALAAALRVLRPGAVHWFGHHTGAALALQVAVTHPEQVARLALSGPCLLDETLRARLREMQVPSVSEDGSHLHALWTRLRAKDPHVPSALTEREVLSAAAAGGRYAEAYRAVTEVDTAAQLRALRCPTLVFAGTADLLHPQLDAAFRLLADGRKAELPGAGSYVCERQADDVAALLLDFLGDSHG